MTSRTSSVFVLINDLNDSVDTVFAVESEALANEVLEHNEASYSDTIFAGYNMNVGEILEGDQLTWFLTLGDLPTAVLTQIDFDSIVDKNSVNNRRVIDSVGIINSLIECHETYVTVYDFKNRFEDR